jgi:hypothetical protein
MLAMLCSGSIAQVSEQNYALAFKTVASTLQRCGVELGYRKIEAACATLNQHNALFRKLAFAVFCCTKKQLWAVYEPCEGLDHDMVEEDVDRWEKKIRPVEVKDFAKSQVSLMSFCLHHMRFSHENIQLGAMKKLEEAVIKAQADISSFMSITARLEEKRLQVNTTLQKIKSQTAAVENKVRQFQLNQRKVRKTLKLTDDHYSSTALFEATFPLLLRYAATLLVGSFGVLIVHRLFSPLHEFLLTIINAMNTSPLSQALPEGPARPNKHF